MVLPLKRWKSRTPPGFVAGAENVHHIFTRTHLHCLKVPLWWLSPQNADLHRSAFLWISFQAVFYYIAQFGGAGWSSPVARQAHNLKVVGSNPTPATKKPLQINNLT
jgi:hypothetical protein